MYVTNPVDRNKLYGCQVGGHNKKRKWPINRSKRHKFALIDRDISRVDLLFANRLCTLAPYTALQIIFVANLYGR